MLNGWIKELEVEVEVPEPVISVVIPVHNRERTLRYCLDSVLAQSYPPAEVLVVDDCSSDRSVDVALSFRDPRVKVLRLAEKGGAQKARNAGIRAATGEWIAFQDSDDEWLPEKLARQVEALQADGGAPLTMVHTDCWRLDGRTGTRDAWELPAAEGDDVYRRMLASGGPMFPGMLISREALLRIGLLDEEVPAYQEWETAIRLARICRFIHIREPLFVYHCHGGDTISGSAAKSVAGYRYIVEKFRCEIIEHLGAGAYDAHLRFCALKAMGAKDFAQAATLLGSCCAPSPKNLLLRANCALGKKGGTGLARRFADLLYRRLTG